MQQDAFKSKKKTEKEYYSALILVSDKIGKIIATNFDDKPENLKKVARLLKQYSNTLDPWARKVAKKIIDDINSHNLSSWSQLSERMRDIFAESYKNNDGAFKVAKKLQNDQVKLIKTLPSKAAVHMQELSREYFTNGIRHEELAKRVQQTTGLVKFRAACIARTEVAKAQTALTQARSKQVGIKHYRWRTMGDSIVREQHQDLEGKIFEFGDPPEIEREGRHGPGDFPNCRCYAEPIIEEAQINGSSERRKKDKR